MAGKSTFLRSLGVNYILAMAGMPVFADQLIGLSTCAEAETNGRVILFGRLEKEKQVNQT